MSYYDAERSKDKTTKYERSGVDRRKSLRRNEDKTTKYIVGAVLVGIGIFLSQFVLTLIRIFS
jgi:hypothetical protein